MLMHKRILSERERGMLQDYLNNQTTPKDFKVLKMRVKRYYGDISQDFILLKKCYEKFQAKNNSIF